MNRARAIRCLPAMRCVLALGSCLTRSGAECVLLSMAYGAREIHGVREHIQAAVLKIEQRRRRGIRSERPAWVLHCARVAFLPLASVSVLVVQSMFVRSFATTACAHLVVDLSRSHRCDATS
jgi:hypothetical protein